MDWEKVLRIRPRDDPFDTTRTKRRIVASAVRFAGRCKIWGGLLCDELLSPKVKKALREANKQYLVLVLDDAMAAIPWELLRLGRASFSVAVSPQAVGVGKRLGGLRCKKAVFRRQARHVDRGQSLRRPSQRGRGRTDLVQKLSKTERRTGPPFSGRRNRPGRFSGPVFPDSTSSTSRAMSGSTRKTLPKALLD